MNVKWKKVLSIAQVALQIPMLALWWMVYNAAYVTCHTLQTNQDGGFILSFDPSKLPRTLMIFAPLILPLVACMLLSIWGMVRILKGKHTTGFSTALLYGGILLACGLLVFGFSQPAAVGEFGQYINHLTTSEYMFYRYPFGLEIRYDLISSIWPFLQSIKYVLLGALAAVSCVLCVDGITKLKKI